MFVIRVYYATLPLWYRAITKFNRRTIFQDLLLYLQRLVKLSLARWQISNQLQQVVLLFRRYWQRS